MGATSVRVAVVDLDADAPQIEIVHRWQHGPDDAAGRLGAVALGASSSRTSASGSTARFDTGPLASIGDRRLGRRLRAPRRARPPALRPAQLPEPSHRRVARRRRPHRRARALPAHGRAADADQHHLPAGRARSGTSSTGPHGCVMLPELVAYELTGEAVAERSNAGTTGLLDVETGDLGDRPRRGSRRRAGDPPGGRAGRDGSSESTEACRFTSSPPTTRPVLSRRARSTRRAVASSRRGRGSSSGSSGRPPTRPSPHAPPTSRTSRGARRLPLPEERSGLLAARPLRRGVGRRRAVHAICSTLAEAGGRRSAVFDVRDDRFLAPDGMEAEVRDAAGLAADAARSTVVLSIVRSLAAAVATVARRAASDPSRCGSSRSSAVVRRHGSSRTRSRTPPAFPSFPAPWRPPPSATRSSRVCRSAASRAWRRAARGRPARGCRARFSADRRCAPSSPSSARRRRGRSRRRRSSRRSCSSPRRRASRLLAPRASDRRRAGARS